MRRISGASSLVNIHVERRQSGISEMKTASESVGSRFHILAPLRRSEDGRRLVSSPNPIQRLLTEVGQQTIWCEPSTGIDYVSTAIVKYSGLSVRREFPVQTFDEDGPGDPSARS